MDAARTFSRVGMAALGGALVLTMAGGLVGCGTAAQTASSDTDAATEQKTALEASVSTTRTVMFPASYFEAQGLLTEADQHRALAHLGCTDLEFAEDGSCTATIENDDYEGLLATIYDQTMDVIDNLVIGDDYPNIVAVDYDEQFATVTVSFDSTSITAADALVAQVPGLACTAYQQIAGLPPSCDVILVGSDGSELANTLFPEGTATL